MITRDELTAAWNAFVDAMAKCSLASSAVTEKMKQIQSPDAFGQDLEVWNDLIAGLVRLGTDSMMAGTVAQNVVDALSGRTPSGKGLTPPTV